MLSLGKHTSLWKLAVAANRAGATSHPAQNITGGTGDWISRMTPSKIAAWMHKLSPWPCGTAPAYSHRAGRPDNAPIIPKFRPEYADYKTGYKGRTTYSLPPPAAIRAVRLGLCVVCSPASGLEPQTAQCSPRLRISLSVKYEHSFTERIDTYYQGRLV